MQQVRKFRQLNGNIDITKCSAISFEIFWSIFCYQISVLKLILELQDKRIVKFIKAEQKHLAEAKG